METPSLKREVEKRDAPPPQVEATHKAFKAARPTTPAPPDAPTDAPIKAEPEPPKFPTLAQMQEFNKRMDENQKLLASMTETLKEQEKQINEYDQLFKVYRAANQPFPPSALGASQEEALVKAEGYAAQMRHAAGLSAYQVLDTYATGLFVEAGGNKETGELAEQFLTDVDGELIAPDRLITKAWEKIGMMEDAIEEANKKKQKVQ